MKEDKMPHRHAPLGLNFQQTMLCFFIAFMWVSVLAGALLALIVPVYGIFLLPLTLVLSATFGALIAILVVPFITLLWVYIRLAVGENGPICLLYGALVGGTLAQFSIPAFAGEDGALLGGTLGLIGGGIYWLNAEKEKRLAADPMVEA